MGGAPGTWHSRFSLCSTMNVAHTSLQFVGILFPISCLLLLGVSRALTSDECMRRWPGYLQTCLEPSCGYLTGTFVSETFFESLSPTCQAIMQQFTARPQSELEGPGKGECTTYDAGSRPTSPVVVQTGVSPTFVMCTVPKAGCSQLRTLLLVMTRHDSPLLAVIPTDEFFHACKRNSRVSNTHGTNIVYALLQYVYSFVGIHLQ